MKRGRWGKRKRRAAVVALAALAIAVVAELVAPGAGAVVANPGDLKVVVHLTLNTPTFTVDAASTDGTGAATLQPNGLVNIPKASLSFAPAEVHLDVPSAPAAPGSTDTTQPPISSSSTIVVTLVPTSDFYGGIDPSNGSGFIVGNVEMLWDQTGTLTGCTIGPFRVFARTNAQGATPYSAQTGKVSMVDPGFTLGAIPAGATGCNGYESGINGALSLPVTTTTTTTQPNTPTTVPPTFPPNSKPPVPSVVVGLTFTPAPRRVVAPPPVHHPNPPTVTQPTVTAPPVVTSPPGDNGGGNGNGGGRTHSVAPPPPARRHPHHSSSTHRKHHPRVTKPTKPAKKHHTKTKHPAKHHAVTRTPGTYLPHGRPVPHHLPGPRQAQRVNFVTAAFVKPSPSVLSTGLDIVAFIAMLVFSSVALWLVTSEVSAVSANARRLRTHRIAGITRRNWPR